VQAVRADEHPSARRASIAELRGNAGRVLKADAFMIEVQPFGIEGANEDGQKIGAMHYADALFGSRRRENGAARRSSIAVTRKTDAGADGIAQSQSV
jgi:hypothetical protein